MVNNCGNQSRCSQRNAFSEYDNPTSCNSCNTCGARNNFNTCNAGNARNRCNTCDVSNARNAAFNTCDAGNARNAAFNTCDAGNARNAFNPCDAGNARNASNSCDTCNSRNRCNERGRCDICNRKELLDNIRAYAFAIIDIGLYLDTNPDCEFALEYYNTYRELHKDAVDLYEANYGPLSIYGNEDDDRWKWNCAPWPWEGGDC